MELKMQINRDELIKKIVDKLSEGLTYEELLKSYRDNIVDSLEESTDEELIELEKTSIAIANGEIPEVTEKDYLLMLKKLAEIMLESSNEREIEERVKLINPRMSLSTSKKTLEELQIMAKETLKNADEKLKQLEEQENGNN